MICLLDAEGNLSKDFDQYPQLSKEQLHQAYELMCLARAADEWAVNLNRQGRMPTYPPNKGQEANAVGPIMALQQDDWLVPAFRELGAMLFRGIPLWQYYLTFLGSEKGNAYPIEKHHTLPISVPMASQTLHAVGLGYKEKYRKTNKVTLAYAGDGATSEGDFYEALNFAGVWKTATIFYVQNNQWAISTPRKKQTAAETIAQKATAAGFEGIQIDGNDLFATYAITKLAEQKARKGEGPTLIEGVTYRLGAHTTADDPSRYRAQAEVDEWSKKDPLIRLEKFLVQEKYLNVHDCEEIKGGALEKAKREFDYAEKLGETPIEETYQYMFYEQTSFLKDQLKRKKELRGGTP